MIVSVHIPKAGGSSFCKILHQVYGAKLWANYSRQWTLNEADSAEIPEKTCCLHGHFEADAFSNRFPDAQLITWLRHPVSRTISLYRHILNRPDLDNTYIREVYERQPDLLEFSQIPWVRNNAFNYLKCLTPEDFIFIGFVEDYAVSLRQCAKTLAWSCPISPVWENKDPSPSPLNLTEDQRNFILEQNCEEVKWYNQARKRFPQKWKSQLKNVSFDGSHL